MRPPPPRKKSGLFPTTDWIALDGAKAAEPGRQHEAATHFAERYWRPVYCYLRGFGHDRHRAEDLTQDFFARFFESGALAKAEPARGRFRSFLLGALTNFLRNQHRDARAGKRIPPEMIVSIHAAIDRDAEELLPRETETPEAAFDRAWSLQLIRRVLAALEAEMAGRGQEAHFDILRRFLIAPSLEGAAPPDYATLAREHGIDVAQVGFRLTTARRAFRARLKQEIREFARTDGEVDAEVGALFAFLAGR
jgi:RNA polymerase sigma-70 factor (ECF subfamily)